MSSHGRSATDARGPGIRRLAGSADALAAGRFLDAAERDRGAPLVDEQERQRLRAVADGAAFPAHWHPCVAEHGDVPVGYGAVTFTAAADGTSAVGVGDVAVHAPDDIAGTVRDDLLDVLARTGDQDACGRLQIWVRQVAADELEALSVHGFAVARRLAILGRELAAVGAVPEDPSVTVRPSRPGADDQAVVEVLAQAYAGTDEAGWDHTRFAERRELPWFRAQDLLIAENADGEVLGLHWLKRRGNGVGEVYNLAVHPRGQGRGLGALLLAAGLEHLRSIGCHEVLLWVDRANERAVRLYTDHGFTTRWEDVALERQGPSRGRGGQ